MGNSSATTAVFTLSNLNTTEKYREVLFAGTLLFYCLIWVVNLTIIITILVDSHLHEPMYIFLCNLCINALYGTSAFYPKFLNNVLTNANVISHTGCLLQSFAVHAAASAEFTLLTVMALDRYAAICHPLIYRSVMTKQKVGILLFYAWLIPHLLLIMSTIPTSAEALCGSHIPKIYCINYLVGKLACTPSLTNLIIIPAVNYSILIGHFIVVIWSYFYLIKTCITSQEGRNKFMKTCLPHLFCLITASGCMLFDVMFVRVSSKSASQTLLNFIALEFLIIPPIVNPLIYGFKLTKIRNKMAQFLWRKGRRCIKL